MMRFEHSVASLRLALREAWGRDTSSDPRGWSPDNPAWGQCAVTALVVQDALGGDMLRAPAPGGSHYWNRLPDGTELDLTREQFGGAYVPDEVELRDRSYVLSFETTHRRYELLRARLQPTGMPAAA